MEIFLVTPGVIWSTFVVCFLSKTSSALFYWPVVGGFPQGAFHLLAIKQWLGRLGFLCSHLIGFPRTEVSSQFDLTSPFLPVGHPEKEGNCSCLPPPTPHLAWCHTSSLQHRILMHPQMLQPLQGDEGFWWQCCQAVFFSQSPEAVWLPLIWRTIRKPRTELPGLQSVVLHLPSSEVTTPAVRTATAETKE